MTSDARATNHQDGTAATRPKVDGRPPALPGAAPSPRSRLAPAPAPAPPPTPSTPARSDSDSDSDGGGSTGERSSGGSSSADGAPGDRSSDAASTAEGAVAVATRLHPTSPETSRKDETPPVVVEPSPSPATADDATAARAAELRSPFGTRPRKPRDTSPLEDAPGESLKRELEEAEPEEPPRRGLPVPPRPPFQPSTDSEGAYQWEVTLPSAIGSSVTIRVGESGLSLDGTHVDLTDIASVKLKLEVEAALLRRAASARMSLAVTTKEGATVKVAARNAASATKADAIVSTLAHLWNIFGDTPGARQRRSIIDNIVRGSEVQVGTLRLTTIGVAWKRHPIVPWSQVGDPVVEKRQVVIPAGSITIEVPIASDDSYVLPSLIPDLRRRFS